jgi:P4 family phage/plasmid primase-like protien
MPPRPSPPALLNLPIVKWLKENNILCYTATCGGAFDKEKGRVSKGEMISTKQAHLPGGWDDTAMDWGNSIMMRMGARPEASGFLAVDIDTRGDETAESVCPELWKKLHPLCSYVVRTGSGGAHLFWKLPAGKAWKKELNLGEMVIDGIQYKTKGQVDILAGGGGILLAGSRYTFKGIDYEYVLEKGTSLADATEVPPALAAFFDSRPIMRGEKPPPAPRPAPPPPAALETAPSPPSAPATPSRPTTPLRATSSEDFQLADKLCACLTPAWLEKYTNWRDMVFCLKAVAQGRQEGLAIAVKHAARSSRHTGAAHAAATTLLYQRADVRGSIGWGSLHFWAKACAPEEHHTIFKDSYSRLVLEGNKGIADILATELAGSCVYDEKEKRFWLYVEHATTWKPVTEDSIVAQYMRRIPAVIGKLVAALPPAPPDANDEDKKRYELKKASLYKKKSDALNGCPEAILKLLRDSLNPETSFRNIDPFEPDANPDYLPLANGVWNFRENRLEEYTRQHYITKKLPIEYNPEADTRDIKEAMRLWFKGNQEHIDFVQYWFGYCLTGHITRQDFLILFGKSAGNGKSTWVEEILQNDILRHFATTFGEDALSRVGGNNDDLYYALGARMAIAPESGGEGRSKELHLPTIKRLTGGGRIAVEAKFKGKKEASFSAKVVCVVNEMPKMPSHIDNGTRRRTNVLEMNVKFLYPGEWDALTPEERASGDFQIRNPEFIRKLRANREGTLLWLLQGAKRYIDNPELDAPESVKRYTAEALASADEERKWFMAHYEFDKRFTGYEVSLTEVSIQWHEAFGVKQSNMPARRKFQDKVRMIVGERHVIGDSKHGYTIQFCRERD